MSQFLRVFARFGEEPKPVVHTKLRFLPLSVTPYSRYSSDSSVKIAIPRLKINLPVAQG